MDNIPKVIQVSQVCLATQTSQIYLFTMCSHCLGPSGRLSALMNSGLTLAISWGVQPLKHSTRRATKPGSVEMS